MRQNRQRDEIQKLLGIRLSRAEFHLVRKLAKQKLKRIIEREGDLNGRRRRPEYLTQLIAEIIIERTMAITYRGIKKAAPLQGDLIPNTIYHGDLAIVNQIEGDRA